MISKKKGKDENILPPIEHETTDETGILHKDGVLSMAGSMPGTTGRVGDSETVRRITD